MPSSSSKCAGSSTRLLYAAMLALACALGTACAPLPEEDDEVSSDSAEAEAPLEGSANELACAAGPKTKPGQKPCRIGAAAPACVTQVWDYVDWFYPDAEHLSGIRSTADRGHFQYVHDGGGEVGIYCHPTGTKGHAVPIYGAILAEWADQGWEAGELGYPIGRERDAQPGWPCKQQGATREQEFEPLWTDEAPGHTHVLTFLCWASDRPAWIARARGASSWDTSN